MQLINYSPEDRTYWRSGGVLVFLLVALFGRKFGWSDTQELLLLATLAGLLSWAAIDYWITRRCGLRIEWVAWRSPRFEVSRGLVRLDRFGPEKLQDWLQTNRGLLQGQSKVYLVGLTREQALTVKASV